MQSALSIGRSTRWHVGDFYHIYQIKNRSFILPVLLCKSRGSIVFAKSGAEARDIRESNLARWTKMRCFHQAPGGPLCHQIYDVVRWSGRSQSMDVRFRSHHLDWPQVFIGLTLVQPVGSSNCAGWSMWQPRWMCTSPLRPGRRSRSAWESRQQTDWDQLCCKDL